MGANFYIHLFYKICKVLGCGMQINSINNYKIQNHTIANKKAVENSNAQENNATTTQTIITDKTYNHGTIFNFQEREKREPGQWFDQNQRKLSRQTWQGHNRKIDC